jgi:hypothetical protein
MYYSGVDLHKDNCFITTVNDVGEIVKQERVRNDTLAITTYFRSLQGPHKAVVESTAGWYWLRDVLIELNVGFVLAHAKYLKAISYAKVKTDKVDSVTLAQLLRMNLIPEAHTISPELRPIRDLLRTRLRLVQKRTACYNSIHRLGEKFNCDHFPELKQGEIPAQLPDLYKQQVGYFLDQVSLLNVQIKQIEQSLNRELLDKRTPGQRRYPATTLDSCLRPYYRLQYLSGNRRHRTLPQREAIILARSFGTRSKKLQCFAPSEVRQQRRKRVSQNRIWRCSCSRHPLLSRDPSILFQNAPEVQ